MNRRQFLQLMALGLAAPTLVAAQDDPMQTQLDAMTLPQKVGQLFMCSVDGRSFNDAMRRLIVDYHIGGLALFDYNISTPEALTQLTNAIQEAAQTPLFLAIDQEGGKVQRLRGAGFTNFPNPMALGAANDVDLTYRVGEAIAEEIRACGLNMNFAPVLDVNSQPRNPIINVRAFGSDPFKVGQHGSAFINGTQEAGVIATAKHFPGHGDTIDDSHYTLPVVPETYDQIRFGVDPFVSGITNGVGSIMSAHVMYPELDPDSPATFSSAILNTLLRGELGFTGLIVTDALTMQAVNAARPDMPAMLRDALDAGVNLLTYGALPNGNPPVFDLQVQAIEMLIRMVESGDLDPDILDNAVRQILILKNRFGILQWEALTVDETAERINLNEHQQLVEEVAARSVTLYRDEMGHVPLDPDLPLALFYPRELPELAEGFRTGFKNLQEYPYPADLSTADAGLIVDQLGERVAICMTYDTYRHAGQAELVQLLPSERTIVIATQSPYDILDFPDVQTYLMCYGIQASALAALRDVLLGGAMAWGRLPVSLEIAASNQE